MPPAPLVHDRSRIRPFALLRPASVAAAADALSNGPRPVRAMAGGIDLINALKCGDHVAGVVYLRDIDVLRSIRYEADELVIGTATTHAAIETDPVVAATIPDLPGIVRDLGNVRVRGMGTIGGNIMAGNRNYDWIPILAALDARLAFVAGGESTVLPVSALMTADGRWNLPGGLLTEVRIPRAGSPRLCFVRRFKPVLSVAACLRSTARGRLVRVAVGCMHEAPVASAPAPIDDLGAGFGPALAQRLPDAHDDGFAGAAYRRLLAGVVIDRAVRAISIP